MALHAYYTNGDPGQLDLTTAPSLPSAPCELLYLNEGGANVVFRIRSPNEAILPSGLQGKLLRVRKDLTHVQCAQQQLSAFKTNFEHLFPAENLIHHELVSLGSGLAAALNDTLKSAARSSRRRDDALPLDEAYGLLVTDMTPAANETFLQLKPKWLAQSPGAPKAATRCRTCALRAKRSAQETMSPTDRQAVCPLALVSHDYGHRVAAAKKLTSDPKLQQFLIRDALPLFRMLRDTQQALDVHGALRAADPQSERDLCKAMTLRDCTLFVKVLSDGNIVARFGDLDLKLATQLWKWQDMEVGLIDRGWYTATGRGNEDEKVETCILSR